MTRQQAEEAAQFVNGTGPDRFSAQIAPAPGGGWVVNIFEYGEIKNILRTYADYLRLKQTLTGFH